MLENKKTSYLKKLLQGQISLNITFWIWFVLLSLFINTIINSDFNKTSTIIIYLTIFFYSIFIFIAVVKSASNYLGNKIWAFLAKVIISINLLFSLFSTYELLKISFFEDYAIKSQINSLKKSLPLKVDSFSHLIDVNIQNKNNYYVYQLDDINIESKYNLNKFKTQVQDSLCENNNTLNLLKKDYFLNYSYIDKNEIEIIKVLTKKTNCGKNIYDLDILEEILANE